MTIYAEIFEGYEDGNHDHRDQLPDSLANRSPAYRFGWLNGRDDRLRKPRMPAAMIRKELRELEAAELVTAGDDARGQVGGDD